MTPREGRWTSPPPNRRRSLGNLGTIFNLLFLIVVFGGATALGRSELYPVLALAVLAVWVLSATGLYLRELTTLRQTRHDRALAEEPDGLDEFAVEIVVAIKSEVVGTDRGAIWFDGELIGFSGNHTSFLLAATDLIGPKGIVLSDWDRPFLPLKPKAGNGKVEIHVRPMFGFGHAYRRRMRRFLRADLPSNAPRQWPPLEPYTGAQTLVCKGVPGFSLDIHHNPADAVDEPRLEDCTGYGTNRTL